MIKSTKGKISEAVLTGTLTKGFPADLVRAAQRKLAILHAATTVDDLRVPPGNRLEKLSGDREGQHSIRINDQWRVCFRWDGQDAHDVEIVDYH
ncbi:MULTISPECIES: type II toxin-antitoxin system RelE/ParE family toxin [Nitrospirillum]|uniref:Killer protein n=2 Tax=Nitrospirillum TaxID=1543705 RepID=A0A248JXP5_9PROT|nr:type II toxin-antitoxin system RelE/ParE family toxin [Nitrospirillum amazonense]ASG22964.1 Killer protein [Nitrospirillum amazonense CBAmc]MEC4589893.1 type II toxin-antitoxin system RelE/ParE family toxin [Nitrospirillum amazonense]TWB16821.1 proteic killer suppression protein [Nitrospirillum amazonense]TWB31411.1 proteic killer suppression protein [Nitrospirillum amazonense]